MVEMKEVRYLSDGQHVWIDDQQWVSLTRLMEVKDDHNKEMMRMIDKIHEISEENKALRVLLGLPKEGPLGMNVENTEMFFDDSKEETKEE